MAQFGIPLITVAEDSHVLKLEVAPGATIRGAGPVFSTAVVGDPPPGTGTVLPEEVCEAPGSAAMKSESWSGETNPLTSA